MRPKKLVGELKETVAKALETKSRKQVCEEFKLSYQQLAAEFGNKWKQTTGEVVVEQEASVT